MVELALFNVSLNSVHMIFSDGVLSIYMKADLFFKFTISAALQIYAPSLENLDCELLKY